MALLRRSIRPWTSFTWGDYVGIIEEKLRPHKKVSPCGILSKSCHFELMKLIIFSMLSNGICSIINIRRNRGKLSSPDNRGISVIFKAILLWISLVIGGKKCHFLPPLCKMFGIPPHMGNLFYGDVGPHTFFLDYAYNFLKELPRVDCHDLQMVASFSWKN